MSSDEKTRIMPAMASVTLGTQLSGIYELDERLGSGGMGEVFRGHNIQTGDPVAIKIVLPEFARDPAILALFRKEASILNHLSHEAIVRYHVFTIDQGIGRPYLAMEFVNGKPLAEVLRQGAMPPERVWRLRRRVAAGLAAAHEAGVIHRDLSPDNIILPGGSVEKAKIIDFGIARSAVVGGGTLLGGKFAGKYNYISPEQLGLFGGEITERSDIYSLGLVLAAALRGKPMDMSGSQLEIIEKRRDIPDLSSIDSDFRPLLETMLQPDPRDRPPSMQEVADWQPSADRAHPAAPVMPPFARNGPAPAPPSRRRRGGALALLALLAAAVVFAGAYFGGLFEPSYQQEATGEPAVLPDPPPAVPEGPDTPPSGPAAGEADEPAQPPPTQPTPDENPGTVDQAENRLSWLRSYSGGDCFYVTATSASATELEGFGRNVEPFVELQAAYESTFGIEPEVGVRLIEPEQCIVTDLLREMASLPARAPELALRQMALPNGAEIRGQLQGLGGRKADVILVDHRGMAYSLNNRLKAGGDAATFSINIGLTAADLARGKPAPQLIVTLASPDGIEAAEFTAPTPAADLFPRILTEVRARQSNGTAVAKYFRLGG
ncbi:serine/threonine-protein kinase [Chelativorans salis]|uniref:Serine/threonine protein kinase n=1 Tax=Chelativorans salis TaxID=2978478 RepID=A0ABT2LIR7_9HYPH|nr:serine/threonine-protein kinase [Chelativorans sp. EGI FJ00035]MCT7374131.1 serine/threonine protein kinase [Chelativorans sp. EGI FJ00035]